MGEIALSLAAQRARAKYSGEEVLVSVHTENQKPFLSDAEFVGKVALVTGAASGIGRATALAFAARGASVIISDRDEKGSRETLELMGSKKNNSTVVLCDVGHVQSVKELHSRVDEKFGRLDFAFNNAGIEGEQGSTTDCSLENWERVININLRGVWLCMKEQIPLMLKNKGGAIINCSSIAGLVGFLGVPAYVASKHGVLGLTKTAALELAKQNITVNAICPGVIQTPMIDRFTHGEAKIREQLAAGEPVGRIGEPEDIAGAVLWLCSAHSRFVTGICLPVDGGWVAQ